MTVGLDDALNATPESPDPVLEEARRFERRLQNFLASLGKAEPGLIQEFCLEDDVAALNRRFRATLGLLSDRIEDQIAEGVRSILHHPDVQQLEASWRGLHYLVHRTELPTDDASCIKVFDISWDELVDDLDQPVSHEDGRLFKLLYDHELDQPGGQPFGLLIVDFEFGLGSKPRSSLTDVAVLRELARIASVSWSFVVTNADPSLVGRDSWRDLRATQIDHWHLDHRLREFQRLRDDSDARFVAMLLPRVLMRPAWRGALTRGMPFRFDETDCRLRRVKSADGGLDDGMGDGGEPEWPLWGGAAFVFGAIALQAFDQLGWFADIRGARVSDGKFEERGGMVRAPAAVRFSTAPRPAGPADTNYFDVGTMMPIETLIPEEIEHALQSLGLLALSRCKFTDHVAIFGVRSLFRPPTYRSDDATGSARLNALVPHTLCACRIAHFLNAMLRNMLGGTHSAYEIQQRLKAWLSALTDESIDASPARIGERPLLGADVHVEPTGHGTFACTIWIEPHVQLETLRARVRLPTIRVGG